MKLIDYILIAAIAAAVIFAIRAIRKGKGHGCCGGSCNGNCGACSQHCDKCGKHH